MIHCYFMNGVVLPTPNFCPKKKKTKMKKKAILKNCLGECGPRFMWKNG